MQGSIKINLGRTVSDKGVFCTRKALRLAAQNWRRGLSLVISVLALLTITACVSDIETRVTFYPSEEWKAEIRLSFTPQMVMLLGGEQALEARLQKEVATRLGSGDIDYVLKKELQTGGGVDYLIAMEGKGLQEFYQAVFSKPYMAELLAGPVSLDVSGNIGEGQILTIGLDSNPSTGYSWEVAEMDEKILRQVGESEFKQESTLLGAAGKQIVRFEAVGGGQTTLKLIYHRPWEKDVGATRKILIQAVGVDLADLFAQLNSATSTPAFTQDRENEGPLSIAPAEEPPVASELSLPSAYNWCKRRGCTPVKDQGGCGSCWAFATVGPLESKIKFKSGVKEDLSEQYLVSCNTDGWGCTGGWWAHGYHRNKKPPSECKAGAVLEGEFPYEGEDVDCCGPCPFSHPYKLTSWACIGDADPPDCCTGAIISTGALKRTIRTYGPISVAVCAGTAFQNYTGGVFKTDESSYCSGNVNHGVVLVGWNDNQGTKGVWILRNSWGAGWGEDGYMRIGYRVSNVGFCASRIGNFVSGTRVRNGCFERGPRIPKYWKGTNLTSGDGRVCTTANDGSCSFLMVGTKASKSLQQVVKISGKAGDTFTLQGWSKANKPSPEGGAYCLKAKVYHTDGTKGNYRACFAKRTHTWQRRETTLTTAKDYNKIVVSLLYYKQGGRAWFDDVRLVAH